MSSENDKEQSVRQRALSNNSNRTNSNTATYRDLVIFEERLRGNKTRLLKRKRKYESKNCLVSMLLSLSIPISVH